MAAGFEEINSEGGKATVEISVAGMIGFDGRRYDENRAEDVRILVKLLTNK